jgi:ankyrin repeat protein
MTALLHALRNRHVEVAKFLIKSGADVNAADKEGKTALMWASPWADVDVARIILEKVAHGMVNASDKERKTALIHAVEGRNIGIIMFLVDNGAWIDTQDVYERNARSYALRYDNTRTDMRVLYPDSHGDGMETARFLRFANIFQLLVGTGPLSELVLDFWECIS